MDGPLVQRPISPNSISFLSLGLSLQEKMHVNEFIGIPRMCFKRPTIYYQKKVAQNKP